MKNLKIKLEKKQHNKNKIIYINKNKFMINYNDSELNEISKCYITLKFPHIDGESTKEIKMKIDDFQSLITKLELKKLNNKIIQDDKIYRSCSS